MHSTNYFNTFIEIAEDCKTNEGQMPPLKGDKKTVANLQFDMLYENPYTYTSDKVLFGVFAVRNGFSKGILDEQREHFFLKGSLVLELHHLLNPMAGEFIAMKKGK